MVEIACQSWLSLKIFDLKDLIYNGMNRSIQKRNYGENPSQFGMYDLVRQELSQARNRN